MIQCLCRLRQLPEHPAHCKQSWTRLQAQPRKRPALVPGQGNVCERRWAGSCTAGPGVAVQLPPQHAQDWSWPCTSAVVVTSYAAKQKDPLTTAVNESCEWAMRDSNPRHPRCKRVLLTQVLILRSFCNRLTVCGGGRRWCYSHSPPKTHITSNYSCGNQAIVCKSRLEM
jgi:hypothetical protein